MYQPSTATALVWGVPSVVGVIEDAITVAVASCLSEDLTTCVLSVDIDPGVGVLTGVARL